MIWYMPGVETSQCHRTPLKDGREILVCLGQYGGQGNVWTQVYSEDLLHPKGNLMADEAHGILEAPDNVASCGYIFGREAHPAPVMRSAIGRVAFGTGPDGYPSFFVEFLFGRLSPTTEQLKACTGNQFSDEPQKAKALIPRMKRFRMDFVFDGHEFKPTPSSASLAKQLGLR